MNHTGDLSLTYSRIVFLQLGLNFPSDREDFLVEMFILLSLVLSGTHGRGAKVKKNHIIHHL